MFNPKSVLTDEIKKQLRQGTKVKFKCGFNETVYIGRIEVDAYGDLFFVNEFNYENGELKPHLEGLRYYNSLSSFEPFTHFEILEQPREVEKILTAAILYNDEKVYRFSPKGILRGMVFSGYRHWLIRQQIIAIYGEKFDKRRVTEGFLTSENRFVVREEAAKIAYQAGQIKKPKKYLISEDLY